MSAESASGTAECPECYASVPLHEVMQNEVTQCPECGIDLEVVSLDPLSLELAPEEEEDWGE